MAVDNKMLGQFDLVGIPAAPRGVPQIEVTFDIDANGIVSVSAKDKATNKEQQIKIQPSGGLSDADIKQMIKDAEANASEDKKRRELVEARNRADSLLYSTEKSLEEHGTKMPEAERTQIKEDVEALKKVIDSENVAEINAKADALTKSSMKLGEMLYRQQQQDEAAASEGASADSAAQPGEKVVDASFEEIQEDKKKSA